MIVGSGFDDTITDSAAGHKFIDGGAGSDEISVEGTSGAAYLYGGDGDDILTGGSGNDVVAGGEGSNQLFGGAGSDILIGSGSSPNELLDGGSGSDWLLARGDGAFLRGGEGNDVLHFATDWVESEFSAGDGHDAVIGSGWAGSTPDLNEQDFYYRGTTYRMNFIDISMEDITVVWNVTTTDQVSVNGRNYSIGIGDLAIIITATGESVLFHDVVGEMWTYDSEQVEFIRHHFYNLLLTFSDGAFADYEGGYPVAIGHGSVSQYDIALADFETEQAAPGAPEAGVGTSGNDDIGGSHGDDTIDAGDGDDYVTASAGNDLISGGPGHDIVSFFGHHNDFAWELEAGDLTVTSLVTGGATRLSGVESIYFVHDDVTVAVADLIGSFATSGNDAITGSVLDDMLDALAGNDTIIGKGGDDLIDGGADADIALYLGRSDQARVYRGVDGYVHVRDLTGAEGHDRLQNVESIYFAGDDITLLSANLAALGTVGADTIMGTTLADTIFGLDGDDQLSGDTGDDELDGGAGADALSGGLGNDRYHVDDAGDAVAEDAGEGTDTVESAIEYTLPADVENLTLVGEQAIDGSGNSLANILTGNMGYNLLAGLGGADLLLGGAGDDVLEGGDGDDVLEGGLDSDYLDGGSGNDIARFWGSASHYLIFREPNGTIIVSGVGPTALDTMDTLLNIETLYFADAVELEMSDIPALGTLGNDEILGTDRADQLYGLAGDDNMTGGVGNDLLLGGLGADTMTGGSGNDFYEVDDAGDVVIEATGGGLTG